MQFLGKLWKMGQNIEILNLSQQKEEGISEYYNYIIILKFFYLKFIIKINEKKKRKCLRINLCV